MKDPEDLWRHQPGDYFFLSTKSPTGKWVDHPIPRGKWYKIDRILADHSRGDIYMCPHGFTKPIRQKRYSVDPFLLYADLDEANPSELSIKPTIALESSPGRYVGYWITDDPTSEELNRRLAYSLGADISGWDRTQVLRVPGTRNRKYRPAPEVKVLWTDGPVYPVDKLERMLPQDIPEAADKDDNQAALKIYRKYENEIPRWARQQLLEGNPRVGKRSEVLWRLQNALIECGISTQDIFTLLWVSPWNKFRDRRGGADQLRNELDKNLSRRMARDKLSDEEKEKADRVWDPLPRSLAQVERRNIDWLVPDLLARKELTIVEGDPGIGKSYLVQVMAGLICDGKPIPVFKSYTPPMGNVAYFDTENTADTVTLARLEENGVVNLDRYFQGEDSFTIDDEERWQLVVDRLRELSPQLVVFDTINTYIGATDTYRSSETQQAMGFFKHIATELDCSVILLRHLTKGSGVKAIYRGQGSIAFTGAARIVVTVATLPDDDSIRVVACTKNNLTKPFRSFTYSIDGLPDRDGKTNRSKLHWGDIVDLSSDALINAPSQKEDGEKGPSEIDLAVKAMSKALEEEGGRIQINSIRKQGQGRGISYRALSRAAEILELERVPGGKGVFYWEKR